MECVRAGRGRQAERERRYWVGVVSAQHVGWGVAGGFAQVCHGRRAPLARMRRGDVLVYYSPSTERSAGEPVRAFTALGELRDERVYELDMGGGFVPSRRDVRYLHERSAQLAALRGSLHFTQPGSSWAMLARRGIFEIDAHDAALIASAMGCAEALSPAV